MFEFGGLVFKVFIVLIVDEVVDVEKVIKEVVGFVDYQRDLFFEFFYFKYLLFKDGDCDVYILYVIVEFFEEKQKQFWEIVEQEIFVNWIVIEEVCVMGDLCENFEYKLVWQ